MTTNTNDGKQTYVYRIDENDKIVYISDNWSQFAEDNDAPDLCVPSFVLKKPLWDFIADEETQHLYKIIVEAVRGKEKVIIIPFRCDSPDLRRFMEMTMTPLEGKNVEFSSRILRIETRNPLEILKKTTTRSEDSLRICSYCKKIAVSENEWIEAEKAIKIMNLFERARPPQLTHGVCKACHESVIAELV